jgi:hypothetical protein
LWTATEEEGELFVLIVCDDEALKWYFKAQNLQEQENWAFKMDLCMQPGWYDQQEPVERRDSVTATRQRKVSVWQ